MRRNRGSHGPRQRHDQKRGPQQRSGFHRKARDRRPGYSGSRPRGPETCPMCGAVVSDLSQHIRERHDDPESHPRD